QNIQQNSNDDTIDVKSHQQYSRAMILKVAKLRQQTKHNLHNTKAMHRKYSATSKIMAKQAIQNEWQ
ncbi:41724_t:CDS:1, partial [Gigaspora margarita]